MLVNVVDAIEPVAPSCAHVSLMQGYKVYGAHLGPFKTPARESDPPHMPPEFNVDQQAFLEARQRGKGWTWSAMRPSVVCGFALGNPMNLAMVHRRLRVDLEGAGRPAALPGQHPAPTHSLIEMTDARTAGPGDGLGGDRPERRQPGVQHQQRRPVPLGGDVAEDRRVLRVLDRPATPDAPRDVVMADKEPAVGRDA